MTDETSNTQSPVEQIQSVLSTVSTVATEVDTAPQIPVAANDVAQDVVDAASLAAASIADAAKLTDPATMASAIVDLTGRLGAAEQLLADMHAQLVKSGLISRIETFVQQYFRM